MAVRVSRASSSITGLFGIVLAFLALAGQISSGALATRGALRTPAWSLLGNGDAICHSEPGDPPGRPAKPAERHGSDCALCPVCLSLALPSPVLASPPFLPARLPVVIARAAAPPSATGPPSRRVVATLPRGPPP
jgi:hypothetical protein